MDERRIRTAANEAGAATADWYIGLFVANEAQPVEWVQLAPFGDWPNVQGLQRFQREDAQAIVDDFNSTANAPQRLLGIPWYVGHPDFPAMAQKYTDRAAKGRIKELKVIANEACLRCKNDPPCAEHGLFAKVKWSDEGKRIIANEEYHGHSATWRMRPEGNVYRPYSLKSVGFTNDPQIPVKPITAANETAMPKSLLEAIQALLKKPHLDETSAANEIETMYNEYCSMKTKHGANEGHVGKAKEKLAAAGLTLACTEENPLVLVACNELVATRMLATTMTTERDTAKTALTGKEAELVAANEKATKAEEKIAANETAAKESRKSMFGHIVDLQIQAGRFAANERDARVTEACNETDSKAVVDRWNKLPAKWRNGSVTNRVGERNPEVHDRMGKIATFVNERMASNLKAGLPADYDGSFAAVQKEHPELFKDMKEPGKN